MCLDISSNNDKNNNINNENDNADNDDYNSQKDQEQASDLTGPPNRDSRANFLSTDLWTQELCSELSTNPKALPVPDSEGAVLVGTPWTRSSADAQDRGGPQVDQLHYQCLRGFVLDLEGSFVPRPYRVYVGHHALSHLFHFCIVF